MLEFLKANWSMLASVLIFIISVVVSLLRKKVSSSIWTDVINKINDSLPTLIDKAEASGNAGEVKKAYCIGCSLKLAKYLLKRDLTADEDAVLTSEVSNKVETLLSLPTKKEVVAHEDATKN